MSTLMPMELNRSQYLVRWLLFIVVFMVTLLLMVLLLAPLWQFPDVRDMLVRPLSVIVVALLIGLRIWNMDVPRIRDIGWSPWLLLLFLVPLAGFVVQLLLFFTPSKAMTQDAERNEPERVPVARREALRDLGGQSGW